jgi:putative tricarboxylic transport membrane protein
MSDRITAVLLLILALWFGWQAWGFRATFFTDPLGARAFPLSIAFLLVPLAAYLFFRPEPAAEWPERRTWPALVASLVTFVAYAYLLTPLGFILANTLVFVVFGKLFAAKLWQGAVVGLAFSAVLYALFVWGLELYLPIGRIFERLW